MKIELNLTSVIQSDGESETITQQLNAFLRVFDEYVEISYREKDLADTTTTIRLYDTKMELIRRGDYTCVMTMETGMSHEFPYQMPYGELMMTTDTTGYTRLLEGDGQVSATVSYTLSSPAMSGCDSYHMAILAKPLG